MFKTILVGTDGSQFAERAVATASSLAAMAGARLIVLHVLHRRLPEDLLHMAEVEHLVEPAETEPRALAGGAGAASALSGRSSAEAEEVEDAIEAIGRRVVEEAQAVARRAGVKDIATRVETGDPARRILAAAKAENADLIVLGRRGLGALEGLVMGSVSTKVAGLADCACLTVR
jgi:nucleotide-binding universal stress UspA family protein